MAKKQTKEIEVESTTAPIARHYLRVVAAIVFGLSLMAFLIFEAYPYLELKPLIVINRSGSDLAATSTPLALTRELPTRLRVPKLSLDTSFEAPLELSENGTITVPRSFEKVGWYKLGAAPGEIGTASILGHVDSYQGPAVFFSLGQLAPEDRIYVSRGDGSEVVFEVDYLERYKQEAFPTEKVYAPTKYASLRLITCSGTYVEGEQRYTHNLVVYAHLVEVDPSPERES